MAKKKKSSNHISLRGNKWKINLFVKSGFRKVPKKNPRQNKYVMCMAREMAGKAGGRSEVKAKFIQKASLCKQEAMSA